MKKVISYIGSKEKLLHFIKDEVDKFNIYDKHHFIDGFSGTTVVSKFISESHLNWDITMFDISKYSKILSSFVLPYRVDYNNLEKRLQSLDALPLVDGIFFNEFSFGGNVKTVAEKKLSFSGQEFESRMFFSSNVGKKIDAIRNKIFEWHSIGEIDDDIKNILLLFVVHYADRNANTTSVYGAFLKKNKHKNEKGFFSRRLLESFVKNKNSDIFNSDKLKCQKYGKKTFKIGNSIDLLSDLKHSDKNIIYLDPPYNTRRYESNYHILNYIVDSLFDESMIKQGSKTGMPNEKVNNPFGSKLTFKTAFEDMIKISMTKAPVVIVSFNDEGYLSDDDITNIARTQGFNSYKKIKSHKRYTSGEAGGQNNGKMSNVEEMLWIITKPSINNVLHKKPVAKDVVLSTLKESTIPMKAIDIVDCLEYKKGSVYAALLELRKENKVLYENRMYTIKKDICLDNLKPFSKKSLSVVKKDASLKVCVDYQEIKSFSCMRVDFLNKSLCFIEKEMLGIISECKLEEKMTIAAIDKFNGLDEKRLVIKKTLKESLAMK